MRIMVLNFTTATVDDNKRNNTAFFKSELKMYLMYFNKERVVIKKQVE